EQAALRKFLFQAEPVQAQVKSWSERIKKRDEQLEKARRELEETVPGQAEGSVRERGAEASARAQEAAATGAAGSPSAARSSAGPKPEIEAKDIAAGDDDMGAGELPVAKQLRVLS
ncbi:unnamed protein product, partial [Prorocentrum cordatum]